MSTHTRRHTFTVLALLAALLATPATAHQINAKDLEIKHPYTVEPSGPAAQDAAVYMVIRNNGTVSDKLIAARSPFAAFVSIEAKDRPAASPVGIDIPAHAETVIGPKTIFLLLHGLTDSLEGYQYIPMTLVFEQTGVVEIEVYVQDASEISATAPKSK